MLIRRENEADREAVYQVNSAAFDTSAEADLCDALRSQVTPLVSLVAEDDNEIVGHIMFSPVTLDGSRDVNLMGLGPMAVVPARQNSGIGSSLVRAGLGQCRSLDYDGVVVLGHPDYYPRFGFVPGADHGLRCEYDVPPEVFMVMELIPGSLNVSSGIVRYAAPFPPP